MDSFTTLGDALFEPDLSSTTTQFESETLLPNSAASVSDDEMLELADADSKLGYGGYCVVA
ncbi:hypothetical protein K435DRAFT_784036 [Dendrothele bispora CBS 962.96]|uniref:Pheromone n=1 Tax=Dendrothele bispora (strain CBS 962.96) TaxID=1314807 RepID=A0A4S8L6S9_DENBC|nr:hypothetical protein K435DRAFT_784036 [Dendrothele bispora CBS 962.96]